MPDAVRIWIVLSSLLVACGWVLSAFDQLTPAGYGIAFGITIIAIFFGGQRKRKSRPPSRPFRRRFKRIAPALFLVLAVFALLGGILYAPSDGGSAAYRIPRVMAWLTAGQWHWIHVFDARLNIAGCGLEWFFAPLILLTHSDRFLFLPNWFSFLLLPGLIFSVFTRMGIPARVAWWWMWLLPSGWCFALQAGSTLNDSFAAVYALASVDFALRARQSQKITDLCLCLVSAFFGRRRQTNGCSACCARSHSRLPEPLVIRKTTADIIGRWLPVPARLWFAEYSFQPEKHRPLVRRIRTALEQNGATITHVGHYRKYLLPHSTKSEAAGFPFFNEVECGNETFSPNSRRSPLWRL